MKRTATVLKQNNCVYSSNTLKPIIYCINYAKGNWPGTGNSKILHDTLNSLDLGIGTTQCVIIVFKVKSESR